MNRNHIHMAVGLPGSDEVISGMRNSANLYIYIDTFKAIQGMNEGGYIAHRGEATFGTWIKSELLSISP